VKDESVLAHFECKTYNDSGELKKFGVTKVYGTSI
jgi:hypothetical protein